MPESLTRREFMKELGKLGAAASLAPMVAAGEQMSDKVFTIKRPSFIKETDTPTVEINWDQMERYDERDTVRRGFSKYVDQERIDELGEIRTANLDKWVKEGKPGYTLKDFALQSAAGSGGAEMSFMPDTEGRNPEALGVPKWEGSAEEAAMLVTAALRHMGAATVGFVELDPNTTEKLIYSGDPDGKQVVFEDVDAPYEDDEKRVIHKQARWVISYTIQMSEETLARAPTVLGSQTTSLTYTRFRNIQARLQAFLWGLGYYGLGEASINALGIANGFAVMAGLGELSRLNRLVTPEYGPMVRTFKMVTDLPLAPTKPIDAGLMAFCADCTKCADYCPAKALSFSPEPSWEVRGGWNNYGHKTYYEDAPKCRSYWFQVGTNCGICFAVCPFASKNLASYSKVRNWMTASMPMFNKTLKKIDDLLYTPIPFTDAETPQKDPEEWWKLNLPDYGINTAQTMYETS